MLLLIIVFSVVFRATILFPPWRGGIPSGYDTYIHAATAYFIAHGGLEASPASPIYSPVFSLVVAFVYQLTGIQPIFLVVPIAVIIDVLCILPMFYITKKMSDGKETMALVAAFFTAINPVSVALLVLGSFPSMFAILGLLTIVAILVSSKRDKVVGILLLGLLGAFVALTNILVAAFYVFFAIIVFFYEVIFRNRIHYTKPLLLSALIAVPLAAIYYVPRLSYFYVGLLLGAEYVLWVLPPLVVTLILLPPLLFLLKPGLRKKYIPTRAGNLKLLKIWYLTTPVMALIFVWQVAVLSRLWHLITFPAIVVLAIVFVTKFRLMSKAGRPGGVRMIAAGLLVICITSSYAGGVYYFSEFYSLTPDRLQLIRWIEGSTPLTASFCAEEEFLPTHLGWYIMGLTGRMSYESIIEFSGPFEVGTDVALRIRLANNITTLDANSTYWIKAVKDLAVTYVILLAAKNHTNYAPISDKMVFLNEEYKVYDVSQYTYG
jgi:hypothetical protein